MWVEGRGLTTATVLVILPEASSMTCLWTLVGKVANGNRVGCYNHSKCGPVAKYSDHIQMRAGVLGQNFENWF